MKRQLASLRDALDAVSEERRRQEDRWGTQRHPHRHPTRWAFHGLQSAQACRDSCERRRALGTLSWPDILAEEVAEAVEATYGPDLAALRAELVQVAAVAVAWIERIDEERADAEALGDWPYRVAEIAAAEAASVDTFEALAEVVGPELTGALAAPAGEVDRGE